MGDSEPTVNGVEPPQKTAKQLEKEAKKQAKLDKLKQKLEKQNVTANTTKEKPEVSIIIMSRNYMFIHML